MSPADPESVRYALNAALLSLADEMDAEAAWRASEAHFARREGRAADAYRLDAERKAYERLADLLRGKCAAAGDSPAGEGHLIQ